MSLQNIFSNKSRVKNILSRKLRQKAYEPIVFMYGVVCNEPPPFTKHLTVNRNIEQFKNDINEISELQAISAKEFIDWNAGKVKFHEPVCYLIFKYGLASFSENVLPVLKAKNLCNSCFVVTEQSTNNRCHFEFKLSYIIDCLRNSGDNSNEWKQFHVWQKKFGYEHKYYKSLLLSFTAKEEAIIDDLAGALSINFDMICEHTSVYLTPEELSELEKTGISVGKVFPDKSTLLKVSYNKKLETIQNNKLSIIDIHKYSNMPLPKIINKEL